MLYVFRDQETYGARPSCARVAGNDRTPNETDSAIMTVFSKILCSSSDIILLENEPKLTHSSLPKIDHVRGNWRKLSDLLISPELTTTPLSCTSLLHLTRPQMHLDNAVSHHLSTSHSIQAPSRRNRSTKSLLGQSFSPAVTRLWCKTRKAHSLKEMKIVL